MVRCPCVHGAPSSWWVPPRVGVSDDRMAGGRISERYLDRYCVLLGTVQQTGSMQMLSLYLASILSVNQWARHFLHLRARDKFLHWKLFIEVTVVSGDMERYLQGPDQTDRQAGIIFHPPPLPRSVMFIKWSSTLRQVNKLNLNLSRFKVSFKAAVIASTPRWRCDDICLRLFSRLVSRLCLTVRCHEPH